jgi:hypothetical protein
MVTLVNQQSVRGYRDLRRNTTDRQGLAQGQRESSVGKIRNSCGENVAILSRFGTMGVTRALSTTCR